MFECFWIVLLGFILDLVFGDPSYRLHPIRIIGQSIQNLEGLLRRWNLEGRAGGVILTLVMEMVVLSVYISLSHGLRVIHTYIGLLLDLFLFYSCLAIKDLVHHIRPVISALGQGNLTEARIAVARVVGRDVVSLNRHGVIRAAIETMAESFNDGFLSPLFWFFIGAAFGYFSGYNPVIAGVSLMLFSKVTSTLDSMIGYKNSRYILFGWAGARLDDIIHFVPARLSLFILFLGAWVSGLHPVNGLRVALRDRLNHDSPNAAHAESFVAGAIHVHLGGPTMYPDGIKNKPWLGKEYTDPEIEHIKMTERLIMASAWISMVMALSVFILLLVYNG